MGKRYSKMKLLLYLITIFVIVIVFFVTSESYKYKKLIHTISPGANIRVLNQKRDLSRTSETFMIYVDNVDDDINNLFESLVEKSKHSHFQDKWGFNYHRLLDIKDDYNILLYRTRYYENGSSEGLWTISMPFSMPEDFFPKNSEILHVLNSIPGVTSHFFISKNNDRYSIAGWLYAVDSFPELQDLIDYAEADVGGGGGAAGRD